MKPEVPKEEPKQGAPKPPPSPVRGFPPGFARRVRERTAKAKRAMELLK